MLKCSGMHMSKTGGSRHSTQRDPRTQRPCYQRLSLQVVRDEPIHHCRNSESEKLREKKKQGQSSSTPACNNGNEDHGDIPIWVLA
jgi:hypothetical protein